jgi:putative transposase
MNPNHYNPWSTPQELRTHLDTLFRKLQTPKEGRNYVLHTMAKGPARQVQARMGGTCVRHFSRKMGATMMLESRRGESALAWLLEADSSVLGYFAQTTTVTLNVLKADGTRATTQPYTADFMVIERDRICIKEVRDNARFLKDSERSPDRFFRDAHGKCRFKPAEDHFKSLGLDYELVLVGDLPHRLVDNLRFLEDYLAEHCPQPDPDQVNALVEKVTAHQWLPLRALLDDNVPADLIFKAIAEGAVHVPLENCRLEDTDNVKLFPNEEAAEKHSLLAALEIERPPPIPGTLLLRSGGRLSIYGREYTVVLQGDRDVLLHDPLGNSTSMSVEEIQLLHRNGHAAGEAFRPGTENRLLWTAPKKKLDKALEKLRAVRNPEQTSYSERSISRFRSAISGSLNDIDALQTLLDDEDKRGNRNSRISELNEEHIQKAIEQHFNTADRPTARGAYEKYVKSLEEVEEPGCGKVQAVSLQTFTRRCKEGKSIKAREGKRAAYQKAPIVALLSDLHPAHGQRGHDVLYVDHTIPDIETRSPQGMLLRKPTLTVAVDGFTRQIRAHVLLYEPPSARSVMLLIRTYIDKHQRVPRVLVVDNGKEFHSHELELLCRIYGIELRYRAPGMPRGGSLVERTFGAIGEEVLSELEGNSRSMKKDTRLITGDMLPTKRACWTLTALNGAVSTYLYDTHPNRVHPELGMSPNEFEEMRTKETGAREHMLIKLDENAMLLTSPHPQRRAKRKVVQGRGVNVYGTYFWNESMRKVRRGTSVEVRVEWWNASVIYAHIGNQWVVATGTSSRFLYGRGNRLVELAYRTHGREARERARKDNQAHAGTSFRAIKLRPEDFDPVLLGQDEEVRRLYMSLGSVGATALPVRASTAANDVSNDSMAMNLKQSPTGSSECNQQVQVPIPATDCAHVATDHSAPNLDRQPANDEDEDDELSFVMTANSHSLR